MGVSIIGKDGEIGRLRNCLLVDVVISYCAALTV